MSGLSGIAAVVLNYKTWQDAVNCVNDLKAQDNADKHIVVVENGSGNDSAARLNAAFRDDPLVTVLVSEKNLGFARGNNMGIRYAHEKLGYDTVFVVNSDTRIPRGLFAAVAGAAESGLGTLSPFVIDRDGVSQPFPVNCKNISRHAFRTAWNLLKANLVSLPVVDRIYARMKQAGESTGGQAQPSAATVEEYALQGSAYFLMPDFFKHYRGIYPRTFLYWEEIDLLLMLKRAGIRSGYLASPVVTHFGGVSTGIASKNVSRFHLKQSNRSMIKSLPLIFGMSEKRIAKCIDGSPEFSSRL